MKHIEAGNIADLDGLYREERILSGQEPRDAVRARRILSMDVGAFVGAIGVEEGRYGLASLNGLAGTVIRQSQAMQGIIILRAA